jgi:hypothetical protein
MPRRQRAPVLRVCAPVQVDVESHLTVLQHFSVSHRQMMDCRADRGAVKRHYHGPAKVAVGADVVYRDKGEQCRR